MNSFLSTEILTMSSREIAELTDKDHKNVIRDIRAMLDELSDGSNLSHVTEEKDSRGYTAGFNLPKRETLILVSGYSVTLRARIIDRWQELENQVSKPAKRPMVYNDTPAEIALRVANLLCESLELHGPVRASMLKSSLLQHAPQYASLVPAYGQNAPRTMDGKLIGGETSTKPAFAATALLRKFKSNLTIHQFNKLVEAAGFLEVRERPSSKYDGVMRTYKAISDKGLKFGMNLAPTDRPQNIQPLWFEHTFEDLLSIIS